MPFSLYWLAVGAFCIGTGTLIIAPLIAAVAAELGVSIVAAGQLVTVYSLTYAVASPILSTVFGNRDRKRMLIGALGAYAMLNLLAAAAQSYLQLLAAQVLLACAAGLFMPAANTVAAMLVPPAQRGRAISVVIGGLTVSVALGVPIGSLIGGVASWRAAFIFVAAIGVVALAGLLRGLPEKLPRGTATLAERVSVARRPEVLLALCVTFLWATGAFSFYTFIAPFLTRSIGLDASFVPLMLFVFGVAGWIGNMVGGRMTDRNGPIRTLSAGLLVLALNYLVLAFATRFAPSMAATTIVVSALVLGGIAGWAFHPSQSARLVQLARDNPVVALSLNQSALYLGSAAGAMLGALTLAQAGPAALGLVAGACELAALATLVVSLRVAQRSRPVVLPAGE